MLRIKPSHLHWRLYCDHYFTLLPLLEYLAKQGILSLGMAGRKQIPGCKLPTGKEIKNRKRQFFLNMF